MTVWFGGAGMSDKPGERQECAGPRETIVAAPPATSDHGLLLDIANLLATKLEPELLFDTIAHVVRQFLNIDRASIALYDSRARRVRDRRHRGPGDHPAGEGPGDPAYRQPGR